MTRDETKALLSFFLNTWPNFRPENLTGAVDAWFAVCGHIPYPEAQAAAVALAAQPGRAFAPAPGELIGQWIANANRAAQVPSTAEAWAMIQDYKPRRRMVYCAEAQRLTRLYETEPENYRAHLRAYSAHVDNCKECGWKVEGSAIPAIVEKVATDLGWPENFPTPDNLDVCRAQFSKAYQAELDRATVQSGEPPMVTKAIERMAPMDAIKRLTKGMERK